MEKKLQTSVSSNKFTFNDDFFEEMYSNSGLKQVTIFIFFFGAIFGLFLELGIIWYEKHESHRYRTAINQLFSTISWLVVSYIILVFIPDGIRYLTGPFGETFCDGHNFLKNFLCICVLLTLDCIIFLRYIFIFKLSNFAVIKDDFIAGFLQISILSLSFWMTIVKRISLGKMPLNYYMCSGKDPADDDKGPRKGVRKYDTLSILTILSFLLWVFASAKIFVYQRKIERGTRNIELGRIGNAEGRNQPHILTMTNEQQIKTKNMPKSMADLTTQFLCMMLNLVFVIVQTTMSQIEPKDLNAPENRWLAYYIQIIGVALAIFGISCQYYLKNRSLLKAIWRCIKRN